MGQGKTSDGFFHRGAWLDLMMKAPLEMKIIFLDNSKGFGRMVPEEVLFIFYFPS